MCSATVLRWSSISASGDSSHLLRQRRQLSHVLAYSFSCDPSNLFGRTLVGAVYRDSISESVVRIKSALAACSATGSPTSPYQPTFPILTTVDRSHPTRNRAHSGPDSTPYRSRIETPAQRPKLGRAALDAGHRRAARRAIQLDASVSHQARTFARRCDLAIGQQDDDTAALGRTAGESERVTRPVTHNGRISRMAGDDWYKPHRRPTPGELVWSLVRRPTAVRTANPKPSREWACFQIMWRRSYRCRRTTARSPSCIRGAHDPTSGRGAGIASPPASTLARQASLRRT